MTMTPAEYARTYAQLFSPIWNGTAFVARRTPIVNYLQHNHSDQDVRGGIALARLHDRMRGATRNPTVVLQPTFTLDERQYLNHSIYRCFIGKGTPPDIQDTLRLATRVGATDEAGVVEYCNRSLGVDCGGFVAAYWGQGVPTADNPSPYGWTGFQPRSFWAHHARRRRGVTEVQPGDAAIVFRGVVNDNPDIALRPGVPGSGSEAFHIGVVNTVGNNGTRFTQLEIADSSSARGQGSLGGDGVRVAQAHVVATGVAGRWIYCQTGANEQTYFLAPPAGYDPTMPYATSGAS